MAQTITVASIKVGLNVDELKKNGDFTRSELNSITRSVKAAETPFQKLAKDVALLDRAFEAGGISAQTYNQTLDSLSKKHGVTAIYAEREAAAEKKLADSRKQAEMAANNAADAQQAKDQSRQAAFQNYLEGIRRQTDATDAFSGASIKASGSTGSFVTSLGVLTGALAATKGIMSLSTASLGLAMQKEQVQAQIDVFTKSSVATAKMMAEFVRLDQASSLSATNFQDAAKTMMQFGVITSDVIPTLDAMSEISMGNNERFQSMALAFGQVTASGRLMGQEVLQFVNAGFNPLQQISIDTGKSMAVLRKEMEEGKISVEMVATAFKNATSNGGQFAGMNEKMAGTTSVKLSKLKSEFTQFMTSFGEREIKPGVDKALSGIISIVDWTKQKKELSAQDKAIMEESERINAKLEQQAREKAKLAKDALAAEEKYLKIQKEAMDAENRRAESAQKSFASRINSIAEENARAKMGDTGFEEAMLRNSGEFGMTAGERMQAESAIIQLRETRGINALRKMKEEYERLQMGEKAFNMEQLKLQGVSESDLKKIEGWQKAIDAETQRKKIAEEIATLEKNSMSEKEKSLAESARVAKMFNDLSPDDQQGRKGQLLQQRQQQIAADFAKSQMSNFAANIAPALKSGTVEAFKFIQGQNAKSQEAAAMKKIQEDMLAEMRKQSEQNANAPRLQFARV